VRKPRPADLLSSSGLKSKQQLSATFFQNSMIIHSVKARIASGSKR